jgi:phage baseplate assembly protein W
MDDGAIYGRGISFPPRLGVDGRWAWSVGAQNIREAIQIILLTIPGERLLLTAFGGRLKQYLFEPNTVATRRQMQEEIVRSLKQWEPRVSLDNITVDGDPTDARVAVITINYRLVASQAMDQISMKFQFGI